MQTINHIALPSHPILKLSNLGNSKVVLEKGEFVGNAVAMDAQVDIGEPDKILAVEIEEAPLEEGGQPTTHSGTLKPARLHPGERD